MYKKWKSTLIGIAIALFGFLFQVSLQTALRPYAKIGIYFQGWSSETQMQTVSIRDLQEEPLKSLWHIHIQPPALDFIRAVLVHIAPASDSLVSLHRVDHFLYLLWAILYGLLGSIVFFWLLKLTNKRCALILSIVFLLHPACIFYATLLDSTLLASLLILLMYYLLWKVKNNYYVSPYALAFVVLALFFTRSIFQWPFIVLFAVSLILFHTSKRTILIFLLVAGSVSGLYMIKQYNQFGTTSTSSFTGLNLTNSVGMKRMFQYTTYLDSNANLDTAKNNLANVLTRKKKINGAANFNHINYLKLNDELITAYKNYIRTTSVKNLVTSYLENLSIYLEPSSRYSKHVIVDRIPWRSFYDRVFSYPVLNVLILISGISWLIRVVKRKDYFASLGLLLPGAYIFLVCVLFEKGENMRFKFFLEPVIFIFLISEFYNITLQISARIMKSHRLTKGRNEESFNLS